MRQITAVTGVIGADIHCIGLKILEHALRSAGIKVASLGITVTQKEFIEAAIETRADAILVSSLYGQAEMDAKGLREDCVEAGIGDILLYIGGNLNVGIRKWEDTEATFKALGFDRVFPPLSTPQQAIDALRSDVLRAHAKAGSDSEGKE